MKHAQRDGGQQARRNRRQPPHRPPRRQSAGGQTCREATAVLRQVTPSRINAAFAKLWELVELDGRGAPYDITHTHFAIVSRSPLVSKSRRCCKAEYAPRGRELFGVLMVREKRAASELDLSACRERRFKQTLRPPFRVARNGEGGGYLATSHLR
jgi:hypothetical protein